MSGIANHPALRTWPILPTPCPRLRGCSPGPHLALQGQNAAKNHSPGFWHTQGIYRASTGAPILLSVPWEQMKSGMGRPVCARLGVSEAKACC